MCNAACWSSRSQNPASRAIMRSMSGRRSGDEPGRPARRVCGREETERVGRVADEQVLRLLVVLEHHLVRLTSDAGLLIAAERRVRGVGVIAVRPHATGLDLAAGTVAAVAIAGPHAGAQ